MKMFGGGLAARGILTAGTADSWLAHDDDDDVDDDGDVCLCWKGSLLWWCCCCCEGCVVLSCLDAAGRLVLS